MSQKPEDAPAYGAPLESTRMPDPQPSSARPDASQIAKGTIPNRPAQANQPVSTPGQKPSCPRQTQGATSMQTPASIQASAAKHAQAPSQASVKGSRDAGTSAIAWPIALVISVALLCTALIFSTISCTSTVNDALGDVGIGSTEAAEDPSPKIGVISIASSISYDGSECSPTGLKKLLDKAKSDDSMKGVILWVNSGGGTATAGEEMAAAVKEFDKPIVVVTGATNASAAYEISSQADKIFVGKTSAVGSIGVVLQVTDLSGLYEKLGIRIDNITSADSKDATYGNRPLTDEEREWYQAMVNQISDDFIKTVAEGRDMSIDKVKELANGLTYTGLDAVENGLADSIGYLDDAISYISEQAGYTTPLKARALYLATSTSISDLISILGRDDIDYLGDSEGIASLGSDRLESN